MINENDLRKRLTASVEAELGILPYQMGVANMVLRRIVPKVLEIIKEEVRAVRREQIVETAKK
jgi:hypothetical protein